MVRGGPLNRQPDGIDQPGCFNAATTSTDSCLDS